MKMAWHQAIFNQGEIVIIQRKEKIERCGMSLQNLQGYLFKRNNHLDLEENSDA